MNQPEINEDKLRWGVLKGLKVERFNMNCANWQNARIFFLRNSFIRAIRVKKILFISVHLWLET